MLYHLYSAGVSRLQASKVSPGSKVNRPTASPDLKAAQEEVTRLREQVKSHSQTLSWVFLGEKKFQGSVKDQGEARGYVHGCDTRNGERSKIYKPVVSIQHIKL